jgi:hypothetical protein
MRTLYALLQSNLRVKSAREVETQRCIMQNEKQPTIMAIKALMERQTIALLSLKATTCKRKSSMRARQGSYSMLVPSKTLRPSSIATRIDWNIRQKC